MVLLQQTGHCRRSALWIWNCLFDFLGLGCTGSSALFVWRFLVLGQDRFGQLLYGGSCRPEVPDWCVVGCGNKEEGSCLLSSAWWLLGFEVVLRLGEVLGASVGLRMSSVWLRELS